MLRKVATMALAINIVLKTKPRSSPQQQTQKRDIPSDVAHREQEARQKEWPTDTGRLDAASGLVGPHLAFHILQIPETQTVSLYFLESKILINHRLFLK